MKKSRLALALATLTSISLLAGCGQPVKKGDEGVILSFTGLSGEKRTITADDLFNEYETEPAHIQTYYDAIYEVYVRYLFEDKSLDAKLDEINRDADIQVSGEEEKAKSNKETNDSTFDEEMETIFSSYGVENKDELKQHFIYELMKEEIRTMYFDADAAWTTTDTGDTWTDLKSGYLDKKLPYHVKHILVKLSGTSSTIETSTLTSGEATKLSGVVRRLATQKSGETFGDIALEQSDDGSQADLGNLGIMDKDTGYVNEFKLGIYAYDAIYNEDNADLDAETKALLVTEEAANKLETIGLGEIPYQAALKIGENANKETATDGTKILDGNTAYYPRNIYFNQFFNNHNISVITPTTFDADGVLTLSPTYQDLTGFRSVPELGGKEVLTDENGNVILVTKAGGTSMGGSYEGVHFIVVERSALDEVVNGVSLNEYYSTSLPGDIEYPTVGGEAKDTYINYMATERTTYQTRANEVKGKIEGYDSLLDYRIFNQLVDSNNIEIIDKELSESLSTYIDVRFSVAETDAEEAFEDTWNEWIELLDFQAYQKEHRAVSLKCADAFLAYDADNPATTAPFEVGGICYVK